MNRRGCHHSLRRGFSHVELLICLVIILALASIVLSALQRSRESARSSQCKDHLHNIGLAIQNYEGVSGSLPMGVVEPDSTPSTAPLQYGYSWGVGLLPFIEQNSLYNLIDFHRGAVHHPKLNAAISIFRCSSDSTFKLTSNAPMSSYAGAHHHVEADIAIDNLGSFIRGRSLHRTELVDGTQYTIAIGEKLIAPDEASWVWGTSSMLRNAGTPLEIGRKSPPRAAPSTGTGVGRIPTLAAPIGGFGSEHPWGANMAFHSGAVRMIPKGISLEVLQQLAHRADGSLIDIQELQRIEVPHD